MKRPSPSWLETAVFYEIYPQSFYDSNGDGIGDIPGIIQKLDYLVSLGVNAVWLNPCFASPFADAGYDVYDYYQVAPRYGANEDLRQLFVEAKKRGIHILLDLVPGHTSIECEWFKASCKHERNEYTDWYIWTDSVWTPPVEGLQNVRAYAERNAAYIINFFWMQPALNYGFAVPDPRMPWQQPVNAPGPQAVRREIKKIMKFWLDMGADGFRVDMAASLVKLDKDLKATSAFWTEVREWLDREYPQAAIVSEWSNPSQAIPAGFHMDFYIHFNNKGYTGLFRKPYAGPWSGGDSYGFSFFDRRGQGNIRQFVDDYMKHYKATRDLGFISIPSGNHDIPPRLSHKRDRQDLELAFLFLMTMPGVPYIYYGDEIGMRDVNGLPSKEGGFERTAARTPMQWDNSPNAGFSSGPAESLYLPVDSLPDRPTVAAQQANPGSLLQHVCQLVALRKAHPALCASGDFQVVYAEAGEYPFIFRRTGGGEDFLVVINPSGRPTETRLPEGLLSGEPSPLYGQAGVFCQEGSTWVLKMPPVSGGVYRFM